MSWQATAWVSKVEAGGPSGKLLLYALANYADENGRCWPSDARLMADTEMGERTIRDWKRKLEEAGLLSVERRRNAGGTFQADEIRLAMDASGETSVPKKQAAARAEPPANAAGGEAATTGDSRRDHRQLTPPPPASDDNPPTPPYKAEPSKEPSEEPVERGREREDRKKAEGRFWALAKRWPGFAGMPKEPALKVWLTLSASEMDEAERKFDPWLALLKAQRKSHVPAPSTYFGERLFRDVPEPVAEAKPEFASAAVFGPAWGGLRMLWLTTEAPKKGPPPSAFMAQELLRDDERGRQARRTRQATHGWPEVNQMHLHALSRKGVHMRAELADRLKPLMEPVMVGSDVFDAWRAWHEAKGWPWIPDPGSHPVVYFPAGGPDGLERFVQAIRDEGSGDDGGARQAAE